ncbi:TetR/AcrR family transcriptional regulator [Streptomyces sp. NBC_01275]|uniref:TetR/AcrR family transcriptional regulator n=1 Tax=Streptomyces sp. NBC_01275 TaxID=2903807 RepID=UPI002256FBF3|nr:TetR/AcrR family transcriptional regulator [Streptomyces sp. NBC_01275]MCX4765601.1 TetR/AcrR family transcriptional regulator [Streptomyces sp. NBC_01275]
MLLRAGATALTSRAVTAEAGCAKGVLRRRFADFDAFLAELVLNRIGRLRLRAADPDVSAGTGAVVGDLTAALTELFGSVAVAIVALVVSRDGLRARLRAAGSTGVPLLAEAAALLAEYPAAERARGRIAPDADADADTLAPALIGAAHLLFAGGGMGEPPREGGAKVVRAVVGGVVSEGGGEPGHDHSAPMY